MLEPNPGPSCYEAAMLTTALAHKTKVQQYNIEPLASSGAAAASHAQVQLRIGAADRRAELLNRSSAPIIPAASSCVKGADSGSV